MLSYVKCPKNPSCTIGHSPTSYEAYSHVEDTKTEKNEKHEKWVSFNIDLITVSSTK